VIYFCSVVLLLCGIVNIVYYRDALVPSAMQPLLWCLLLAGASFAQDDYFPLSQQTLFLCVAASLLFQVGFGLAMGAQAGARPRTTAVDIAASLRFRNLLLATVVLLLPFFVRTAYALATSGPVNDMAFNLRYSLSEEGRGYGILAYGVTLSLFLVILEATFFDRNRKWRLIAACAVSAVFCVLMTGRTFVLALLVCCLFPFIIERRISTLRGFLLLILIFLPAFYLYSVTLGKDGGSGMASITQVFKLYLFGGLFAFDKMTQSFVPLEEGANLFRAFYVALDLVSPPVAVTSLVDSYEYIPEPTNVYTVFSKAFRDFGIAGVAIYLLLIGGLYGVLYQQARKGSMHFRILLVYGYFALLMQFFQDQYLALLSTWTQLIVLTWLFATFTRPSIARSRLILSPAAAAAQPSWPSVPAQQLETNNARKS
jgi:oligosaccharide repeat unit polymerase